MRALTSVSLSFALLASHCGPDAPAQPASTSSPSTDASPPLSCGWHLGPPSTFVWDYNPNAMAAGDLNGDGLDDLVFSEYGPDTLGVVFNRGDGTFGALATYAQSTNALILSIAIGDVNRDGFGDIAVVDNDYGVLGVFINRGDGTFHDQVTYALGDDPYDADANTVVFADVNGDGALDIVVCNYNVGGIGVWLNDGTGAFGSYRTYYGGPGPTNLAVADFHRDGLPDVVTTSESGLTVFANDGTGGFGSGHLLSATSGDTLVVADFRGDGFPDIVADVNYAGAIFYNNDHGQFGAATTQAPVSSGAIAAGDFNGDGFVDVALSIGQVELNDGTGRLIESPNYSVDESIQPFLITAGDFFGDGRREFAAMTLDHTRGLSLVIATCR